ncbi:DUF1775 domain-containing protein [Aurantimonas sp. Leaf443]|uniref:DUF1775 domain-containing protein n=1 Tax=Aurantimonas sp. Leaf443 TaxID=1736378 RepID=UPI0009EAC2EE|nr:DUF1775 domain-containing protein [Aurantimonas sp. Leaf443]
MSIKTLARLSAPLLACALPGIALAHVSVTPPQAAPDATVKLSFGIGHGCDGAATQSVSVRVPEGVLAAKPMPKPGWTIEIVTGAYARPYQLYGKEVSSGPVEIRWTGGTLDDAWYDEFTLRARPTGFADGAAVPFVVTQTCEGGTSLAWDEIAKPGEDAHALDRPAPVLLIGAPAPVATAGVQAGHAPLAGSAKAGALAIEGGFVRAMLPGAKVGGGYLTIRNAGPEADRLVSVSTPAAGGAAVHEMAMEGEVMRMRALETGLAVPAGESVALAPGGLHLMFTDVAAPFAEGATVPVTLTFEKAGAVDLELPVLSPRASAPDGAAQASGAAASGHAGH